MQQDENCKIAAGITRNPNDLAFLLPDAPPMRIWRTSWNFPAVKLKPTGNTRAGADPGATGRGGGLGPTQVTLFDTWEYHRIDTHYAVVLAG